MNEQKKVRVLMVCLGNICRSPTAQGVFEETVSRAGMDALVEVDSAGTGAWHIGSSPDARATEAASRRGYDLTPQRARKVRAQDFEVFDYILAMDHSNYADLLAICPPGQEGRVRLFLDYLDDASLEEVPDPYYGGLNGFEHVLDLVERSSERLLDSIRQRHFE